MILIKKELNLISIGSRGVVIIALLTLWFLGVDVYAQQPVNIYDRSEGDSISLFNSKDAFKPQVPDADRYQKDKVFLERADMLLMDDNISLDYQIITGDVQFRKEGMFMFCDSAYFYEQRNSLDAFGNVRMEQGDTLFVYADVMYYDGLEELARLRGNVRMINRDVTLYTDSLDYDMAINLGFYFEGGRMVDTENELTSIYGQYSPDTKDAEFLYDVTLVNEKYVMETDTLHYNTDTQVANIVGYTTIVSDSSVIYSVKGWYDTKVDMATLYERSLMVGKDNEKLTGDTLFYDRNKSFGEAFGNMVLSDSINKMILKGDYGFHDDAKKVSFATRRALVMEYSQGDTLYLHGDSIRTFLDAVDSTRFMTAYHKVRFFRDDMQGVADSISYQMRDSMMYMYRNPIIWNENKQIMGREIQVHMNDSTMDWALLPNTGIMAEHIEDSFYNQLSGKEIMVYFKNGTIDQMDVNGNVETLVFPTESDSTFNKMVRAESSFMMVKFKDGTVDMMKMWPSVTGKAYPLFMTLKTDAFLGNFRWYEDIRPKDKEDIFVIPQEMVDLIEAAKSAPSTNSGRNSVKMELPKMQEEESPEVDMLDIIGTESIGVDDIQDDDTDIIDDSVDGACMDENCNHQH